MSGWATCRNCHQRIWWGSAPFDSSRNWPFDDQDEQTQHVDTCSAIDRVIDAAGNTHRVSKCRACGERVWWDTTPRGKRRPMNISGGRLGGENRASDVCHFDTCPGEPVGAASEPAAAQPFDVVDIDLWLAELGLKQPVTLQEIISAYRTLAYKHHPDMGGNASDFIRIKLARDRCLELLGAVA